ncbi:tRNA (guanosine(18)-2'-O)-methyltransferase TrmH [Pseudomaricurvus sp. HS19]|uniref:tRNA (guanosine(18)-2'-O)-methyltransferase TrmH n=1 Tax=Pseudomaricurvus sp. HS19 TaxID=2692626 RepID=UPI00137215B3|nr:tRNA (guanosine(18)-2'-O)-methyltransferase TrmH [Pseudomaricurvus sp. HS19]MYM62452.1 tRNA (guanosine(18)-2'-O)-methyltransferase TrmH [Pseudomaricurvus sp. HS19]
MTPERYATIRRVLDYRQPDLTVITDEVHKGRNLSAIVRTCDAVGIPRLHCVEPRKGYRAYRGTALGSHKWVDTRLHNSIGAAVEEVRAQGFRVVAANLSERAVDYRQLDYTQPTALLLGTEKEGVSPEGLEMADAEVIIPMVGMVESFNVSVAAAIILTEVRYQRQQAGLYDQSRLDQEEYQRLLFRWCQPVVSAYCDERGLDYPPLDDEGEIVNPSGWYQQVRAEKG